ncbi:helix-turn-helix domain-containing protein, partial [Streptomyces sp. NPDC002920]
MTDGGSGLGAELRRRREAAGLTLRSLAREISYDKGHLSRVERGMSPPGRRLVELYDLATGAGGKLAAALLPGAVRPPSDRAPADRPPSDLPSPDLPSPDLPSSNRPRGAAVRPGWVADERESALAVAAFQASLAQLRTIGRELPPGVVLPALDGQFRALSTLTSGVPRPDRRLLRQAARTAEYAGWMAQEAGDAAEARRWTGTAAELAARAAHRDLRAYTWVRRAELELYAGRPDLVLEPARCAS